MTKKNHLISRGRIHIERHDAKEKNYPILHELIIERREITQQYYVLKKRLDFLYNKKATDKEPAP